MMGQTTRFSPAATTEQGGREVLYAPSLVQPMPAQASSFAPDQRSVPITPSAGGGPPAMVAATAPACLNTDMALAMMACIANPTPECLPMLDPNYLNLELCPGQTPPPVPQCMDQQLADGISYCEQYGYAGANKEMNALCWLASKNPGWYDQVSALPPCGGEKTPEDEKKKKTLMIGGIILLVVAGGATAYYFSQKKKKGR